MPQHVATATGAVEQAAEDEQQVGEPVDVAAAGLGYGFGVVQLDHGALGAAADGSAEVGQRGGAGAAGQDEFLEHRQVGVEFLGQRFEPADLNVLDDFVARHAKLAAEIEEVVLDVEQRSLHRMGQVFAEQHAEAGIQLVDFADGVDAQAVLGRAAAVAEAGGAGVTGAGDDFGKAVALAFAILLSFAHVALLHEVRGLY